MYPVDENGASERHVTFWILNKVMQNYDEVSIQVIQELWYDPRLQRRENIESCYGTGGGYPRISVVLLNLYV